MLFAAIWFPDRFFRRLINAEMRVRLLFNHARAHFRGTPRLGLKFICFTLERRVCRPHETTHKSAFAEAGALLFPWFPRSFELAAPTTQDSLYAISATDPERPSSVTDISGDISQSVKNGERNKICTRRVYSRTR